MLKICSELENNFLEAILGAASEVGAEGRSEDKIAPGEAEFAIKRRSEKALTVGARGEIAAIQRREAVGAPVEKLAKGGEKFRFAVFAEPLEFVFITAGAEAGEFGGARIKPAEGIGKFKGLVWMNFVSLTRGDEAGLRAGPVVQGENQGAIETAGVIGAGGVAEVMIEVRGTRTAVEELAELVVGRGGFRTFTASAAG